MAASRDEKLDELLGRAIRDEEFRERLTTSPKEVAEEVGLDESELSLFAAALAIGSKFPTFPKLNFCTGRICNESSASQVKMPTVFWDGGLA